MQIPDAQKLEYLNGTFHWVFPDDIPLNSHRKVAWYIQKVREEIDEFLATVQFTNFHHLKGIYHQIDTLTYEFSKPYYFAIAKLINIPRVTSLTPESRYRFFVQQLELTPAGLQSHPSQLDILMGAESCEDEDRSSGDNKDVPSSGDVLIDVEASLRLSFKHNADSLILGKGLISCLMLMKQAARQMEMAQEEADKIGKDKPQKNQSPFVAETKAVNIEREALDPTYVRDRPAIAEALSSLDISLPEED